MFNFIKYKRRVQGLIRLIFYYGVPPHGTRCSGMLR
jgi:hypothetical protein